MIHSRQVSGEPNRMAATAQPRKRRIKSRAARREPMAKVDTAWLRMEQPINPMMITGVLMFADTCGSPAIVPTLVSWRPYAFPSDPHLANDPRQRYLPRSAGHVGITGPIGQGGQPRPGAASPFSAPLGRDYLNGLMTRTPSKSSNPGRSSE